MWPSPPDSQIKVRNTSGNIVRKTFREWQSCRRNTISLSNENDNRAVVSEFRGKIARCRFSPSHHGRHPNQPTALRAVCPMTL